MCVKMRGVSGEERGQNGWRRRTMKDDERRKPLKETGKTLEP